MTRTRRRRRKEEAEEEGSDEGNNTTMQGDDDNHHVVQEGGKRKEEEENVVVIGGRSGSSRVDELPKKASKTSRRKTASGVARTGNGKRKAAADKERSSVSKVPSSTEAGEAETSPEEPKTPIPSAKELWKCNDPALWEAALAFYPASVERVAAGKKKKGSGARLLELDSWMWGALSEDMKVRTPQHLTLEEVEKIMEWKISRGKFRPLMRLVKSNADEDVRKITETAFAKKGDTESSIKELTKLKGIGPATASALLVVVSPESAPFMSDEAMLAIPKCTPIQYKLPHYLVFAHELQEKAHKLSSSSSSQQWGAQRVGQALWAAHYHTN